MHKHTDGNRVAGVSYALYRVPSFEFYYNNCAEDSEEAVIKAARPALTVLSTSTFTLISCDIMCFSGITGVEQSSRWTGTSDSDIEQRQTLDDE